ncbi:hypothetical protein [Paraliobacillus ryukyuensis]|uniref:hypothetical protein n=1 Tax=Paraliobacillus ryukyuensis TaxID=200904 RepID=UPI0009A7DA04|nr:hypothetical protein [Paraliobacillus ryukyuensis]
MRKKKLIAIIIVCIIIAIPIYRLSQNGLRIIIKNQTNQEITGLYVTYDNIKSDIMLPSIGAKKEVKCHIDPSKHSFESFDEAEISLQYINNQGKVQTENVIGYFEKGYTGKANIKIKSVDKDGHLEMEISNHTSLY